MGRSNTNDDVFIGVPPDAVFRAIEAIPRDLSWWPRAQARGSAERITVRAPAFGVARPPVRFGAQVDGVRPGEGIVWRLDRGELVGRGEFWLEPFKGGTVVHYYLDVDPGPAGHGRRFPARVRRHRLAIRRGLNALKDFLEAGTWRT